MSAPVGDEHAARFRAALAERLGLSLEEDRLPQLRELLARRLAASGLDAESYLAALELSSASEEIPALARELTVPETYFFRHLAQFRAFIEVAVPDRLRRPSVRPRLRVLSAGCASGEEPYSLAILLHESGIDPGSDCALLAVDVNPEALERAERARYSAWALRETSPELRRTWFAGDGRDFRLDPAIREAVRFQRRNLVDDAADLWQPGGFDVVFCRNLLMYLTPAHARALIARIASALAPGGYLFLGHAETLRGLSTDFHLIHTHDTFYYRRRGPAPADQPGSGWVRAGVAPRAMPIPALDDGSGSWVDAIRGASHRIAALAGATPARSDGAVPATPVTPPAPRWDLAAVMELLRHERFTEALALLAALPDESRSDPDVLLLQAVLLTHAGELDKAESACRRLLALDELDAGAHYLLALCREATGDLRGAADHDQVALYLDPGFAMPQLHLGLLARRSGDAEQARRELARAAALLEREGPARLLLFGGGFGREALIALCGGRPR